PPTSKKTITAAQKETLRRWIQEGANYEKHWSFLAPSKAELPVVKDEKWVRKPIDRFVLAGLESRGLTPAPQADRRTLARRVALDLTGLPPAPEMVEAFVNDTAENAYEKLVDKLLESSRWGEHRAKYWLDAARYADSHGIHFDNFREIWAYREWVVRAFNRNLPFDQFTIEQLAGDLLPNRTLDQHIASGFNRCNITTSEGGTIPEEYLVLYTRDRTETTSAVWMGLTANCAVCHDHKFDPLSQREFYRMAAFFNNTTQPAMDGNVKDTPPILTVPMEEDRPRFDQLAKEIPSVRQQIADRKQNANADFNAWVAAASAEELGKRIPQEGLEFHAPLAEGEGKSVTFRVKGESRQASAPADIPWDGGAVSAKAFKSKIDNAVEFGDVADREKDQPFTVSAWVKIPAANVFGAIAARMDNAMDYRGWDLWVENGKVGTHIVSKWPSDALKVVSNTALEVGKWQHVTVIYDGSAKASGVKILFNGKSQPTSAQADALRSSIRSQVPFKLAQRSANEKLNDVGIQDLRLYSKVLSEQEASQLATGTRGAWLVSKPAADRTDAEKQELFDWWLVTIDKPSIELTAKLASLEAERSQITSRGTIAHVMQEKADPALAFVLFRGEYDQRRDEVQPATPDVLPPMPEDLPKNRLGFAQWLLRPEHPLTARVTVNRFWQELFGAGIVRTSGDFGVAGELPANQELLDWMAVEFHETGWDVKKFFKMLVMSATYQQSAQSTPEKLENDPQNRFLSRGPRFRMEAEMVRDYALAASGLLVEKIGGPSVKPYQPDGVWAAVAMIGSNTRDYRAELGPNLYRRSLYTFWKRSAPPASMEIFNAPSRELCTVRRERTNTPLQALVTLNDPQFVEAARALAQRALTEGGAKMDTRIAYLAERLISRPLTAEELAVVKGSLTELLEYYSKHPDDAQKLIRTGNSVPDAKLAPTELAGWTMLTNELMNLDEVLNK
ncbi:MAG: DUF1553 domain-containing protein, partial [Planctomycetota bacterium]|nr:DUF1553 domain-containing protein [Planctomycetota bacterium]